MLGECHWHMCSVLGISTVAAHLQSDAALSSTLNIGEEP